jgi:hypothetical protein
MLYRYFGLIMGVYRKVVTLKESFLMDGGHVAVWLGVNNPYVGTPSKQRWVQGGSLNDMTSDGVNVHPLLAAYIEEVGPQVKNGYRLRTWPIPLGTPVSVTLTRALRNRKLYRITIKFQDQKHHSEWCEIGSPTVDAVLELLGHCKAVATIGRHTVKGNTLNKATA